MEALILTAVSESGVECGCRRQLADTAWNASGLAARRWTTALAEALRDFADRVDGRITREVFGVQLGEVRAITQIDRGIPDPREALGVLSVDWPRASATPALFRECDCLAATGTPHVHPPIRSCPRIPCRLLKH